MEDSRAPESAYKHGDIFCYKVNLLVTGWINNRDPSLILGLGVSNDDVGMEVAREKGIYLKARELEDLKNLVESGQFEKTFETGRSKTLCFWDGKNATELTMSLHPMYGRRINIRQGSSSIYVGYRHFMSFYKELQNLVYGYSCSV